MATFKTHRLKNTNSVPFRIFCQLAPPWNFHVAEISTLWTACCRNWRNMPTIWRALFNSERQNWSTRNRKRTCYSIACYHRTIFCVIPNVNFSQSLRVNRKLYLYAEHLYKLSPVSCISLKLLVTVVLIIASWKTSIGCLHEAIVLADRSRRGRCDDRLV